MSAKDVAWAQAQVNVQGHSYLVLLALADGARTPGAIQSFTHASHGTVMKALRKLVAGGYAFQVAPNGYAPACQHQSQSERTHLL